MKINTISYNLKPWQILKIKFELVLIIIKNVSTEQITKLKWIIWIHFILSQAKIL